MTPKMKLYDASGVVLKYTFPLVQDSNIHEGGSRKSIVHLSPRGKGAVVIPGGEEAFTLFIRGILYNTSGYEALIDDIEIMKAAIVVNTPYVLTFDQDSTHVYSYNVKRIDKIDLPVSDAPTRKLTKFVEYTVNFVANSW